MGLGYIAVDQQVVHVSTECGHLQTVFHTDVNMIDLYVHVGTEIYLYMNIFLIRHISCNEL